ncbi:hypothetical protein BGS_0824 [Beggiatoa sp. SS]|nr:hypothetical protein BGS_0824 [Beggiatoa sp. SS]
MVVVLEQWEQVVDACGWRTFFQTPLVPPGNKTSVCLSIACSKRLNQLEFYYPVAPITAQGLHQVFAEAGHSGSDITCRRRAPSNIFTGARFYERLY